MAKNDAYEYANLDLRFHQLLIEQIEKYYLIPMEKDEKNEKLPYFYNYDAINGLTCFLSYFLNYSYLHHI